MARTIKTNGARRGPKPSPDKAERIWFTWGAVALDLLDRDADEDGRTRGDHIRFILREHLRAKGLL